ncbi:Ring hydroxylating alpha subunit (catalytic domain) [Alteribacillus persepolensis]|uniref:Ring hydroxylating alpha subunit (Catalytic domain) n=1 Tax=Alteribacillus persepolensis TaxID=568899 RepID=A0A1G8J4K3_9BACI|nr:aromatic ring-hydroxylating dioxygenase subunit alpha [Alteribacillus persepolensis]SDI25983.1 Ring hydroxylating alpha subunit (catalytic domain) [Alteribacillus persepolensis]
MTKWDWDYLIQDYRVHRSVYTDSDIFALEMKKIYGDTWVYLAHESEIPNVNDYKTTYLGLRPVIVTRDNDGAIRALFNRCTHRGATICRMDKGNTRNFTCPYHGWNFANDGRLAGVPWKQGYETSFDKNELNLKQLAKVESYRGFIFGTINEDAPSLQDHLGNAKELLDEWIDRYDGEIVVRSNAHRMVLDGNWKFVFDNAADGYHVSFSHRSLLAVGNRYNNEKDKDMTYFGKNPDSSPMYVQYLGNGHVFLDQRPMYDQVGDRWEQQRPQPGREAYEKEIREEYQSQADHYLDLTAGAQMNLSIFPNLLIIGNQIQVIEPIAVDQTRLTWYATTVDNLPDEINTLRMRSQEDFPAFGEPDDVANFAECQRGLSIPEVEWVMFNRGYNVPDRQKVDERGVITAPVTDETPMRNYFQEWKRLLTMERSKVN